jgi:TRAP-type mannitol/chloroaromatic compound transport system substrate-binding protein
MEAIEKYKADGVKINTWSDEDLAIWKEAAAKVYKRHSEKDPTFKRLYDSSMKFKKKYYKYYETFGAYKGGDSIPYSP